MRVTFHAFVLASASVAMSAASACGNDADAPNAGVDEAGTGDGAPGDGSAKDDAATTPDAAADAPADVSLDASVYPDGVTNIVITEKGGYLPPAPDGSTCTQVDDTFTIALPARDLTWKRCRWLDGGPLAFVTGQKTLSIVEYEDIDIALHAVSLSTRKLCGADKPVLQITFTTASGDVTYHDDFYSCLSGNGKTFVTGLDPLVSAITPLTD